MSDNETRGGVFNFDASQVRALALDCGGEVVYSAIDTAMAMRYADAAKAVRINCTSAMPIKDVLDASPGAKGPGILIDPNTPVIHLPDVLRLAFTSTLKCDDRFRELVASYIVPQILENGQQFKNAVAIEKTLTSGSPTAAEALGRIRSTLQACVRAVADLEADANREVFAALADDGPGVEPAYLDMEVRARFAPYLTLDQVWQVLRHYGESGSVAFVYYGREGHRVFTHSEMAEVFAKFVEEGIITVGSAKRSAIVDHVCFGGDVVTVSPEAAQQYLNISGHCFVK